MVHRGTEKIFKRFKQNAPPNFLCSLETFLWVMDRSDQTLPISVPTHFNGVSFAQVISTIMWPSVLDGVDLKQFLF